MVGGFAIGPSVLFSARPVFCRSERSGRRRKGERAWASHRHQRSAGLDGSRSVDGNLRRGQRRERFHRQRGAGCAEADANAVADGTTAAHPEPDSNAPTFAPANSNADRDTEAITHTDANANPTAEPNTETVSDSNRAANRYVTTTAVGRTRQCIDRPASNGRHPNRIG
jgi:hypothetical protein